MLLSKGSGKVNPFYGVISGFPHRDSGMSFIDDDAAQQLASTALKQVWFWKP
jgi:hypothetical protein